MSNSEKRARRIPTIPEPLTVGEWWRNRSGQSIRVVLRDYNGHPLLDVRNWWTGDDGVLHPGKGFACRVKHLPQLAATIAKALTKARELGLIGESDA